MRGLEPKKQEADRVRPFVEKHKEISLKSHRWFFLHHTAVFRARARVLLVGYDGEDERQEKGSHLGQGDRDFPPVCPAGSRGRTIEVDQIHHKSNRQQVDTLQTRKRKSGQVVPECMACFVFFYHRNIHLSSRESQILFVPN